MDISFTVTITGGAVMVFPACPVEEDESSTMGIAEEIKETVEMFLRNQGRKRP